jgi:DnaJ-class molecular chaperone
MDNTENIQQPGTPRVALQRACSAAGIESEVCEYCEGYGSISYNPNLNPNAFPATATAKCTHCGGTGSVEKAKPQPADDTANSLRHCSATCFRNGVDRLMRAA